MIAVNNFYWRAISAQDARDGSQTKYSCAKGHAKKCVRFLTENSRGYKKREKTKFSRTKDARQKRKPTERNDFEIRRENGVTENPDGSLNFGKMDLVCKIFGAVH